MRNLKALNIFKKTSLVVLTLVLAFLFVGCSKDGKEITITGNSSMQVGGIQNLKATFTNDNSAAEVTWTSSDPNVATVSASGAVEAKVEGSVDITATLKDDKTISKKFSITITKEGEEVVPNLKGRDFIIMVNIVSSSDPRSNSYTGSWQEKKVELIEKVEKKYNIHIKYQQYPAEAVWGGGRERWIISNAVNKNSVAHIYEMPSYSIAVLAEAKAILPLDDLIIKYGNKGYWPEKANFGKVLDKQYSYDDSYPLAGQGIFYNIDLLEELLGKGKGTLPSQLWMNGEWTWEKFEEICNALLPGITGKGIEKTGVIGGRPYNWAYQMLGANGVHVVSSDLKSELNTDAAIDTLTFLNKLVTIPGMWEYGSAQLSNASCPQFAAGNIAFHNGEPYWIADTTKWGNKTFSIGFVPYPKGPNVKEDLSNYYINDVYGKTTYLVSSSYSKDYVQPGYENSVLYDETIFRIWSELQYFPEIDSDTGYADISPLIEEWEFTSLIRLYSNKDDNISLKCHESVMMKGYPDYFYSLYYARSQDETKSFMLDIQRAILNGEVRSTMESLVSVIHQEFIDTYKNIGLTADYYK